MQTVRFLTISLANLLAPEDPMAFARGQCQQYPHCPSHWILHFCKGNPADSLKTRWDVVVHEEHPRIHAKGVTAAVCYYTSAGAAYQNFWTMILERKNSKIPVLSFVIVASRVCGIVRSRKVVCEHYVWRNNKKRGGGNILKIPEWGWQQFRILLVSSRAGVPMPTLTSGNSNNITSTPPPPHPTIKTQEKW